MRALLCVLMIVGLTGCMAGPAPVPRSPLETREIQTREYPTRDTRMVMKALLNVLQDEGFITKNAVTDLGLITAAKEADLEDSTSAFLHSILGGENARWEKNSVVEANANVSEFGDATRVRITFQRKVYDNRGGVVSVRTIDDPLTYQDFFAKVDKGIFIQKQRI